MKLGILQCGSFGPELVEVHGSYPEMIEALLSSAGKVLEYEVYVCVDGQFPESIDVCDAWLISGSKYSAYDSLDWIAQLEDFVRTLYAAQKKTVGICFGHQVMAQAMGGKVVKSERGWGVGIAFNEVAVRKPWMEPCGDTFDIACFHQDQIIEMPKNAEILAGNLFCPYYMLQYGDCFLSIQGHPEFSSSLVRSLLKRRDFQINTSRLREALASLHAPVDSVQVAHWIGNFLSGEA